MLLGAHEAVLCLAVLSCAISCRYELFLHMHGMARNGLCAVPLLVGRGYWWGLDVKCRVAESLIGSLHLHRYCCLPV